VTRRGALLAACWAAPALAGLRHRPLLPIDETRYLTVAWEMWRGSKLVPHLNGLPYSDKPPLLFWLIDAGWSLLGVQEWWARLVPLLLALASLLLVRRLAQDLWPGRATVAWLAPVFTLGASVWAVYQQLVLFDQLLTACVLLGMTGAVAAWRTARLRAWLLVALALGLGVLAKGPVALLHLLPVLLLAPWWMRERRPVRWGDWYARVLAAVLAGSAIALAWAIPAARAGGPEYAQMIFLRQTADRMVSSFAHRRPIWWYVPIAPLLLMPWPLWPPLWRAFGRVRQLSAESGVRFCLAWSAPVFVAFSLISGKQIHYLLPLVPASALLAARLLDEVVPAPHRLWWLPSLLPAAGGLAVLLAPRIPAAVLRTPWLGDLSPWPGLTLLALAAVLPFALRHASTRRSALVLAAVPALVLVVLELGVMPLAAPAYDMAPVGVALRTLERDGFEIAHAGRYAGQYQFAGRLEHPLVVLDDDSVSAWLAAAPRRAAVVYRRRSTSGPDDAFLTLLTRPYRDRLVEVRASSRPSETAAR